MSKARLLKRGHLGLKGLSEVLNYINNLFFSSLCLVHWQMFRKSGYVTLRKWFMSFVASVISEHDTHIHCQREFVIGGAAIGRGIIDIKIITFWPDGMTSLSLRHEWLPRSNLIPDPQFVTAPHLASAHSCSVMIAAGLNCSTSKDSLCATTSQKQWT